MFSQSKGIGVLGHNEVWLFLLIFAQISPSDPINPQKKEHFKNSHTILRLSPGEVLKLIN